MRPTHANLAGFPQCQQFPALPALKMVPFFVLPTPTCLHSSPHSSPLVRYCCRRASAVGRGEVDDELEDEVADECEAKYGPVVRVVIFEVVDESFPEEESVRIFVEFKGSAAAEVSLSSTERCG